MGSDAVSYESIGKNIRKYRKQMKATQEELAEMVDLSVSYMGAIERGQKLPQLKSFIRIANALHVSSDQLLSEVLNVQNEIIASDLSIELSKLPAADQRRILNVIKTMIDDVKS